VKVLHESGETAHYRVGVARCALGAAYGQRDRFEEANARLAEGYEVLLATLGPSSPHTLRAVGWIEALYGRWTPPADKRINTQAR